MREIRRRCEEMMLYLAFIDYKLRRDCILQYHFHNNRLRKHNFEDSIHCSDLLSLYHIFFTTQLFRMLIEKLYLLSNYIKQPFLHFHSMYLYKMFSQISHLLTNLYKIPSSNVRQVLPHSVFTTLLLKSMLRGSHHE